jgi:hypothetical protein
MNGISEQSRKNVIEDGIKRPIVILLESNALSGTIQLVYSGIDAMAFLGMPKNRDEVRKGDFIRWADKFIKFATPEQPSGVDFYGARCAILHQFGTESRMSKAGQCRIILYATKTTPEVIAFPDAFLVSVHALVDALFRGIDEFLSAEREPSESEMLNSRLKRLNHTVRAKEVIDRINAV